MDKSQSPDETQSRHWIGFAAAVIVAGVAALLLLGVMAAAAAFLLGYWR